MDSRQLMIDLLRNLSVDQTVDISKYKLQFSDASRSTLENEVERLRVEALRVAKSVAECKLQIHHITGRLFEFERFEYTSYEPLPRVNIPTPKQAVADIEKERQKKEKKPKISLYKEKLAKKKKDPTDLMAAALELLTKAAQNE